MLAKLNVLSFNKTTDYALIAIAYLAERPEQVWSAREVAASVGAPAALLMKIMKSLHARGIVRSVRGVHGGYQLQADLHQLSLMDLIRSLGDEKEHSECRCGLVLTAAPLIALNYKLRRFLQDVKVSDLVLPGRRIDVPLERVGASEKRKNNASSLQPSA